MTPAAILNLKAEKWAKWAKAKIEGDETRSSHKTVARAMGQLAGSAQAE
jgi:hypothetical protein